MSPPGKLSYRIAEAVQATGLSRATLYRLVQRKELRVLKIGGCTVIRRAELEALLDRAEPDRAA